MKLIEGICVVYKMPRYYKCTFAFHFVERLAISHRWMFLNVRLRICDHSQHVHGRILHVPEEEG